MVMVLDVHPKCFEFSDQFIDLRFSGIPAHVTYVFVRAAAQDEEDRPCHAVGDGDFGFVCRAKPELKCVVLGSGKRASLFCGTICRLDKDLS